MHLFGTLHTKKEIKVFALLLLLLLLLLLPHLAREWPSSPILRHQAPSSIQSAKWSLANKETIGIAAGKQALILKV